MRGRGDISMHELSQFIKNLFHQEILSMTYIKEGLTNDNYLLTLGNKDMIVVRIPKEANYMLFNYKNEKQVIDAVKPLNLDLDTLYYDENTGIKITKYDEQLSPFIYDENLEVHLDEIAEMLAKLHTINLFEIQFDPFNKLSQYSLGIEKMFPFEDIVIAKTKNLYQNSKHVLCHNDLVSGNILFSDDRGYLIDYEYAGNNDPMFDLASVLSENNIEDKDVINAFLKEYYKNSYSTEKYLDVMTYYIFQDILWSYWAEFMYNKYSLPIYQEIRKLKSKRAQKNVSEI